MRLIRLTATFGKLEHETLCLTPGLNLLELPNEGGKSTWCAFLLAMFYGIDTAARASKGVVPDKTKYKPWSGAPMEGRIDLFWKGRSITIERSTQGRIPLGQFRAYETDSGLPVPELTAANCAQQLLGVEKTVFERSAFLRQPFLSLTQDAALEQRLRALVSSGEESVSYLDSLQRLRDWRNHCRHNQSGALPRCEAELRALDEQLSQLQALQTQILSLQAAQTQQTRQLEQLSEIDRCLQMQEQNRQLQAKQEARASYESLQQKAEHASAQAAKLPPAQQLRQWQNDLTACAAALKALPEAPQPPQPPVLPPCFSGKGAEEIEKVTSGALQRYDQLQQKAATPPRRLPWPSLCLLVLALAALLTRHWYAGAACVLASGGLLWYFLRRNQRLLRAQQASAAAAAQLLRTFGVQQRSQLQALAAQAIAALNAFDDAQQHTAQQRANLEEKRSALQTEQLLLLQRIHAALPGFGDDPSLAIASAQQTLQRSAQCEQQAQQAKEAFERLCALVPEDLTPCELPKDFSSSYTRAQLLPRLQQAERALQQTTMQLEHCRGQIAAKADPAALQAQKTQLQTQRAQLQAQYDALSLAMQALEGAHSQLQSQFAPQISRDAANIMAQLTDGRYDTVQLDQALSIQARTCDAIAAHPVTVLSQGTADQLYFSVRLAISHALLPAETPLILDDALLSFDEARLASALRLLQKESAGRQILLFTCQGREKACLCRQENA